MISSEGLLAWNHVIMLQGRQNLLFAGLVEKLSGFIIFSFYQRDDARILFSLQRFVVLSRE